MESISSLVIFNDHHYLLANKPPAVPVQEDQSGDASLHRLLQAYCKQDLYLIHRIDRPVSGAVLFAKTTEAQQSLVKQIESGDFKKTYLAIVPKSEIANEGSMEDHLVHDTRYHKSRIAEKDAIAGKKAVLDYKIIESLDRYQLMEIKTRSGRFHQIRSQLAARGIPIFGDVKYGARRGNPDRSIGLHAWKIEWLHHSQKTKMTFQANVPKDGLWSKFATLQEIVKTGFKDHNESSEA